MATDKDTNDPNKTDFISREAALETTIDFVMEIHDIACEINQRLRNLPAADVVSRDCYDRILAENDTMREQLAAIGKKPGDKMDDVRRVAGRAEAFTSRDGKTDKEWSDKNNAETVRATDEAFKIVHADISKVRAGKGHVDVALRQTPDGKAEMRILGILAETEGGA